MQKKRKSSLQILFWLLALAWIIMLFLLSRQSAAESGALSTWFADLILHICPWLRLSAVQLEPILRKLAHGGGFAVEGFLLCTAAGLSFSPKAGAALSAGFCALMAVLTELVQILAAGRSCEIRDMLIDFGGAAAGILASLAALSLLRRKKRH